MGIRPSDKRYLYGTGGLIMVTIKSKREIELMKEAGRIVALAHQASKEIIKPGVSTMDIDQVVEKVIRAHGATPSFKGYGGFPGSACTSVNEQVVHGIPNKKIVLKDGDIDPEAKRLMDVTKASLFKGLEQAVAGNRLSDISHAIQVHAENEGFSVVREFVGHGVGKDLHEDPQIPN